MNSVFSYLVIFQTELLLFACVCFVIGSLDDLIVDWLWIGHCLKRKFSVYSRHKRICAADLPDVQAEARLAIFIPAWQEAPVIGAMITRCLRVWSNPNFRIYVGCYPNDEATISAASNAASNDVRVRIIVHGMDGPTSKADCLNQLWSAMCRDEIYEAITFKAVILQDAEDIVHPRALQVFDHLIGRAALVQIPVIPRRTQSSRWVAGHYCDEFAEMHTKQMVIREALGASIPSAGVGCAFDAALLGRLAASTGGRPFDERSLTEDYELGLKTTSESGRGIFARIQDENGELVATQEFFPDTMVDAVRQKARWMTGIALTGWDRVGWSTSWVENWMRMRDRKASMAAIVLAAAYLAIIITGILGIATLTGVYRSRPLPELLLVILFLNGFFVIWRLAFKACFVFSVYGLREALLSVPRTVVANIINILAARRAISMYLTSLFGRALQWDKTSHFMPRGDVMALRSTRSESNG